MRDYKRIKALYPGSLFAEERCNDLTDEQASMTPRQLSDALVPKGAFAFSIQTVREQTSTLEDGRTEQHREVIDESGRYYPGGQSMTEEDIKRLDGDYEILLSNMRNNGWPVLVRTRRGNWQPLQEQDVIL